VCRPQSIHGGIRQRLRPARARFPAETSGPRYSKHVTEESTTPDLIELTRQGIDATNRRDLDALMSLYAPDAAWESLDGLGVFEGATAVRGFV
jgi:hypothetical protein